MNKVIISKPTESRKPTHRLEDLISNNSPETAFIGQCGNGPPHELYLIAYECVALARSPNRTWSDSDCNVWVDRFVNLEIKEI